MRLKNIFCIAVSVASSLWMTGCVSTTVSGTTASDRKQLMFYPSSWAKYKSDRSYARFEKIGKENHRYVIDPRLNKILDQLVVASQDYMLQGRKIDWEVRLNLSSTINAMSLPNGKIVVNSAIAWNKLTDDELAFLIAHEMSHVLREHARERKSISFVSNSAALAVSATGIGQIPAFLTVYSNPYVSTLPMSRVMETEADQIGLDLMSRAGFQPQAAISFWGKTRERMKLRGLEYDQYPEFLSSHPDIEERMNNLQTFMPAATLQYQKAMQRRSMQPGTEDLHTAVNYIHTVK